MRKLQRDMMKAKNEIDEKNFTSTQGFLTIEMKGTKEVVSVKIDKENLDKDDIEMLEDLISLAVNDNVKKIEKETESKMGKFGGLSGLM